MQKHKPLPGGRLTRLQFSQYWNADKRVDSGNDQSTPDINLMDFGQVPREFPQMNCVQQASISTRVSISTFAK